MRLLIATLALCLVLAAPTPADALQTPTDPGDGHNPPPGLLPTPHGGCQVGSGGVLCDGRE